MAEAQQGKTFRFELISPEEVLISEPATLVTVPGEGGDFGVLPAHAPTLSTLRPGVVEVQHEQGETSYIFVSGGFADVTPEQCAILAEDATNVKDLYRASLESELKDLTESLQVEGEDPHKLARINRQIDVVKAKLDVIG